MPVLLEIILVILCVVLVFYVIELSNELRLTKDLLSLARSTNERLAHKLEIANQQIAELNVGNGESNTKKTKIPKCLLADDPMSEIFRSVGRLEK